ncbi:MAG: PcfJ domain-containing protein [Oscillospiraceae bacterium]|nr:PcfJ domain-containing protein [Oscillospiraceae bacterium]
MPISSELISSVPRTAPEGLIEHVCMAGHLGTGGIVISACWVEDYGIDAMVSGSAKKVQAVRCRCSACEMEFLQPYAAPDVSRYGAAKRHKFGYKAEYDGGDACVVYPGDKTRCPYCETEAIVVKAADCGRGWKETDRYKIMSACLAGEADEHGKRPLVLICWYISRQTNREGNTRYSAEAWDAYAFAKRKAAKLTGSRQMYTAGGYKIVPKERWDAPQRWTCDWDTADEIYGLTPELLAASEVENSKLDLYMRKPERDAGDGTRYPVIYLRLWQTHPQAENLVVQGAARILDGLIKGHAKTEDWRENSKGKMRIPEINWAEKRPAQMLHLNKDEWRGLRDMGANYFAWAIYIRAKQAGDVLRIPEDVEALRRYGQSDVQRLIGMAPLGKCLRYLLRQREEGTDPEGVLADERADATTLADYWRMAKAVGWDLDDPDVRWPCDLHRAHDRAGDTYALLKKSAKKRLFRATLEEMAALEYHAGGMLIRPARSQAELTREGKLLHHCVGSYGDAHLSGKPILFIRRETEPGTPFYTLQFDTKELRVIQNRGLRNCARTPEVRAFEEKWLAWVLAGTPRDADGEPQDGRTRKESA